MKITIRQHWCKRIMENEEEVRQPAEITWHTLFRPSDNDLVIAFNADRLRLCTEHRSVVCWHHRQLWASCSAGGMHQEQPHWWKTADSAWRRLQRLWPACGTGLVWQGWAHTSGSWVPAAPSEGNCGWAASRLPGWRPSVRVQAAVRTETGGWRRPGCWSLRAATQCRSSRPDKGSSRRRRLQPRTWAS